MTKSTITRPAMSPRIFTISRRRTALNIEHKRDLYCNNAELGHGSFAPGNAEGGLTTQEEKSMGAYAESGASRISGLLKPGDVPPRGGLYLLDVVPDGEVRFSFPNINDNAEIAELIAVTSSLAHTMN
jgi:altronate dehydratase